MLWFRFSRRIRRAFGLFKSSTVSVGHGAGAVLTVAPVQRVNLHTKIKIHGHCNVVKNAGKPDEQTVADGSNVLRNAGRDALLLNMVNSVATNRKAAVLIATSTNADAESRTITNAPGIISTGGLAAREATTRLGVAATGVCTLTRTFTATAAHAAIAKSFLQIRNL